MKYPTFIVMTAIILQSEGVSVYAMLSGTYAVSGHRSKTYSKYPTPAIDVSMLA